VCEPQQLLTTATNRYTNNLRTTHITRTNNDDDGNSDTNNANDNTDDNDNHHCNTSRTTQQRQQQQHQHQTTQLMKTPSLGKARVLCLLILVIVVVLVFVVLVVVVVVVVVVVGVVVVVVNVLFWLLLLLSLLLLLLLLSILFVRFGLKSCVCPRPSITPGTMAANREALWEPTPAKATLFTTERVIRLAKYLAREEAVREEAEELRVEVLWEVLFERVEEHSVAKKEAAAWHRASVRASTNAREARDALVMVEAAYRLAEWTALEASEALHVKRQRR
jgi:ABC-type multidrug transport system fused ATPase/permease subunit